MATRVVGMETSYSNGGTEKTAISSVSPTSVPVILVINFEILRRSINEKTPIDGSAEPNDSGLLVTKLNEVVLDQAYLFSAIWTQQTIW